MCSGKRTGGTGAYLERRVEGSNALTKHTCKRKRWKEGDKQATCEDGRERGNIGARGSFVRGRRIAGG